MDWPQKRSLELIELYYDNESLWNSKHEHYKSKSVRRERLESIAKHFDCHVSEIEKKIAAMRGQFQREYRKIAASQKVAVAPEDVYTTKWFAYDLMLPMMKDKFTDASFMEDYASYDHSSNSENLIKVEESDSSLHSNTVNASQKKTRKRKYQEEENLGESYSALDSVHVETTEKDEFSAFADNVAWSLRKIRDPIILLHAKHKINNVLFEAEMESITKESFF